MTYPEACTHSNLEVERYQILTLEPSRPKQTKDVQIRFNYNDYANVAELEIIYESKTISVFRCLPPFLGCW